jgi:hypothetical protein
MNTQTGPYCFKQGGFVDTNDNTQNCNFSTGYGRVTPGNVLTDQLTWQASGLDTATNAIPNFAITATTSMFQCNINQEAGQFAYALGNQGSGYLLPLDKYTDFEVASTASCTNCCYDTMTMNPSESYSSTISGALGVMIADMKNNC